jgi:hypothetical protein
VRHDTMRTAICDSAHTLSLPIPCAQLELLIVKVAELACYMLLQPLLPLQTRPVTRNMSIEVRATSDARAMHMLQKLAQGSGKRACRPR